MLLLLSSTALGSKNDALASSLIDQARQISDVRAERAPPFRLRMSFRVIKGDGTANEGVYTELWISKAQWRRETEVGGFRRIEVVAGRKRWLLDTSPVIPEHIGEIPALSEFGKFPGKWKSAKDREIKGVSLRCLEKKSDLGSSALCFDKGNGTAGAALRPWQLSTRIGERSCSYSDFEKYGDRMFATSYECDEDKRPLLQARILELVAAPSLDSSLFAPPNGAKESVNCLDSVELPKVLSAPNLPPPTRDFSGTIVVLVSTVVGTDGRTHDLRVRSQPRRAFDETAIETVRQWRFTPGRCGGEPMETEVFMQVAFTHY
jgi:TonB family protein